jgi:uncharacterized protein YjbJ (UPF0337 family)
MSTRTQQWKGRIKQAAGSLTGNRRLEGEGRAQRRAADAREHRAEVKGKVEEALDKAERSVASVLDAARGKRRGR